MNDKLANREAVAREKDSTVVLSYFLVIPSPAPIPRLWLVA